MADKASTACQAVQEILAGFQLQEHQPCLAPRQVPVRVCLSTLDILSKGGEAVDLAPPNVPEAPCLLSTKLAPLDRSGAVVALEYVAAQGWEVVFSIYAYRSLANALPKASEESCNEELFRKQLPLLQEEVARLHEMHEFRDFAVKSLCDTIKPLVRDGSVAPGLGPIVDQIAVIIHQLYLLDIIKASRPGLARDFDVYNKTVRFLSALDGDTTSAFSEQSNTSLQALFATPWFNLTALADELEALKDGHLFLAHMVHCVYYSLKIKPGLVTLPPRRCALLGALAPLLFLLGGRGPHGDKAPPPIGIEALGRSRLNKCLRILKACVILPGIGDMVLHPGDVLALSPFLQAAFRESRDLKVPLLRQLDAKGISDFTSQGNVTAQVAKVTKENFEVLSAAAALQISVGQKDEVGKDLSDMATSLVRQALSALSSWTMYLIELNARKAATVQNQPSSADSQGAAGNITRECSTEELAGMSEIITCVKGLAGWLEQASPWLQPLMYKVMYKQAQDFVRATIDHMIKPDSKSTIKDMLVELRSVLVDWQGNSPVDQVSKSKTFMRHFTKKLDSVRKSTAPTAPGPAEAFDEHACPPSSAQILIAQQLLERLLAAGESAGKRSFMNAADLSSVSIKQLTDFLDIVKHWPLLVDLHTSIVKASDLSDLWLQEQRIESSGEMPQNVPGAGSPGLPSALLSAALSRPGAAEAVLSPIFLLNDAGERVLADFQVQHLYEEVRLETAALLESLVREAAAMLFSNIKAHAATTQSDGKPINGNRTMYGDAAVTRRLEVLLQQRRLPILGRPINLHDLLATELQRLCTLNTEHLITRFEASSVTSAVEFESQVAVLKAAHGELERMVPLSSWEALWMQADQGGQEGEGRVARHAAEEITQVVLPMFAMDSAMHRFIMVTPDRKSRASHSGGKRPAPMPSFLIAREGGMNSPGYHSLVKQYSTWFGMPHMSALHDLIGSQGLSYLVRNVKDRMLHILKFVLPASLKTAAGALANHLPPSAVAQAKTMASSASLAFFRSHVSNVLGYHALRAELVSGLSEVGNATMMVMLIDDTLNRFGTRHFLQGAPYFGIMPLPSGGLVRPAATPRQDGSSAIPLENLFTKYKIPGMNADATDALLRKITNQYWEGAKPHRQLQGWLQELEDPAASSLEVLLATTRAGSPPVGAAEAAGKGRRTDEASAGADISFHHVLSALIFILSDSGADADRSSAAGRDSGAGPAHAHSARAPLGVGDSLPWGSAAVLCLLQQEHKWVLQDVSGIVLRAAELEGFQLTSRASDQSAASRQTAPAVAAFARNAHRVCSMVRVAVSALKHAQPVPERRPAIPFPRFTGDSLSASLRSGRPSVWVEADPMAAVPGLQFDPVPEVRPGQDPGAIPSAEEEPAASPASQSIRSVTTATSPQSAAGGGRPEQLSELFPLPTVKEVSGGDQDEGCSAAEVEPTKRSAEHTSADSRSARSPTGISGDQQHQHQGSLTQLSSSAGGNHQTDGASDGARSLSPIHADSTGHPGQSSGHEDALSRGQQQAAESGRKRRMLPPPPQHLRAHTSSAPSSVGAPDY